MSDLDLDKIREDHAMWLDQRLAVSELIHKEADDATIATAEQVAVRLSDTLLRHLPALLAVAVDHAVCEAVARGNLAYVADVIRTNQRLIAERDARADLERVADRLREVTEERDRHLAWRDAYAAIAEEARDALSEVGINSAHGGDDWPDIAPSIRELAAERDAWRRIATMPADCPVDGCDGERFELERLGVDVPIVRMSCGHEPEPGSATSGPPAEADPQPES